MYLKTHLRFFDDIFLNQFKKPRTAGLLFFSAAAVVAGNPKVGAADSSVAGNNPEAPANGHPYTACTEDGTEAPLGAAYYLPVAQLS